MENGFSIEFLGFHDGDFNQMRRLTTDQCEEFHRNGVLVVPKAIDVETIAKIRREFHQTLCRYGCDVQDLRTAKNLGKLSSTGGAGGILDIYYESWKMELHEREDLFDIISDLWSQTYCRQDEVLVCDNQMLLKSPYDEKIDLSRYIALSFCNMSFTKGLLRAGILKKRSAKMRALRLIALSKTAK